LAGVPRSVNERAKQILAQLEAEHLDEQGRPKIGAGRRERRRGDIQLTLFAPLEHPLLDTIRETEVDRLTPLDALQLLHKWQAQLKREGGA
jgi:DNA mismatch repair protein MutS